MRNKQDGNIVTLNSIKFVMEDPESVAQISGILWYKLFPNQDKQIENYHNKKAFKSHEGFFINFEKSNYIQAYYLSSINFCIFEIGANPSPDAVN